MTPEQLKAQRERLGLSRPDYAALLGVSEPTLKNWLYGIKPITPVAARLCWLIEHELSDPARARMQAAFTPAT